MLKLELVGNTGGRAEIDIQGSHVRLVWTRVQPRFTDGRLVQFRNMRTGPDLQTLVYAMNIFRPVPAMLLSFL